MKPTIYFNFRYANLCKITELNIYMVINVSLELLGGSYFRREIVGPLQIIKSIVELIDVSDSFTFVQKLGISVSY